jgi:hypothetical protein
LEKDVCSLSCHLISMSGIVSAHNAHARLPYSTASEYPRLENNRRREKFKTLYGENRSKLSDNWRWEDSDRNTDKSARRKVSGRGLQSLRASNWQKFSFEYDITNSMLTYDNVWTDGNVGYAII